MATSVSNVKVYKEAWSTKLQARLSEPNKWKTICRVEFTNVRLLHNPFLTDPTVQSNGRGCSYTYQLLIENDESVTYNTIRLLPQFIDRGDLAQSGYLRQMELAERQAVLVDESIESQFYAQFSQFYVADNAVLLNGSAGSITVSATNIDDIIRAVKREIRLASGEGLLERNGGFFVWRPADFEILEQFVQANGFAVADLGLKNGTRQGFRYMGMDHWTSNLLESGRIVAGVNKILHLGILKDTYGQIMVDDKDPAQLSGIGVVTRADFGYQLWNNHNSLVMDIGVV